MRDYQPRTQPLIPVGHETWLAVSRVKAGVEGVEAQIEWFLRAITAPGADSSQRRYDLEELAKLVLANPGAGHGVRPIDSDTHDLDCKVCGDAAVYDEGGHDVDFDRHPYEMCQGTCQSHEGVHDFQNDPSPCIGWRSYYPDEVADLNAR